MSAFSRSFIVATVFSLWPLVGRYTRLTLLGVVERSLSGATLASQPAGDRPRPLQVGRLQR